MIRRRALLAALPLLGTLMVEAILLAPSEAHGALVERKTQDVYGDIVVIGNTLGWDCGSGLTPPSGSTVTCLDTTTAAATDSSPDVYWRDNVADSTILANAARTSATLSLPSGAVVKYARLYWSALKDDVTKPLTPDLNVTFDRDGGFTSSLTADGTASSVDTTGPGSPTVKYIAYQSSADVTSLVVANGSGSYRVSNVDGIILNGVVTENAYSGWTLVVVYDVAGAPYRHVSLFDGLDSIAPGIAPTSSSLTLGGFKIPTGSAVVSRMGAWGYGGSATFTGDSLSFSGTALASTINPADNFWNSTRTNLGAAVSGLVPNLSGDAKSMANVDLDIVDVSSLLSVGDTTAIVKASTTTTGDDYWLGGIVGSINSVSPDFAPTKTFVDLNGGAVLPGDILEFTIAATNTGTDTAKDLVLRDPIPTGLTYVAGSLSIASGPGTGALTDAAGDDQGEVVGANLTVRLGTGATSSAGGTLAPGASTSIKFRVTVSGAAGTAPVNQGTLTAAGSLGAPSRDYLTDGDSVTPGPQGTTVTIKECDASGGCPSGKVCDLPSNTCVPVGADAGDASTDGAGDGASDGAGDGASDGASDGALDGGADTSVGDGAGDGTTDGAGDGAGDGIADGAMDGATDGAADGAGDAAEVSDGAADVTDASDSAIADADDGATDAVADSTIDSGADTGSSGDAAFDAKADALGDGSGGDGSGLNPDGVVAEGSGCSCTAAGREDGSSDARGALGALAVAMAIATVARSGSRRAGRAQRRR